MSVQAPSAVVMVRPHRFRPNEATLADNGFQTDAEGLDLARVAASAFDEVSRAADALDAAGVTVHLFDDERDDRPDSVFPNNWISTHSGGHVALYPMFTPNRRLERRGDIVEFLKAQYRVQDVIDYSGLEYDDVFLEGTGAMVLDHEYRIAYATRSNRADPLALERFCTNFGYEPMVFDASDARSIPIYHTNVMMAVATEFALVCLDAIASPVRRIEVADRLAGRGRRAVIALTTSQLDEFCGNTVELEARDGRVLALSRRAHDALTADQRALIERSARLLPLDVPTIELAGGSVRCMLAGVHLDPRPQRAPEHERSMAGREAAPVQMPG
ncbi:citrulline utilization hydrolase CtlX [Agromyces humatus]|uniref:Arginine deiminase-related protein n=1 Tax=Agromyces humatus TaxID=279573 RepID=A0ABN2KRR6_9MICO|nr:arginine deiminase-related protein [Agromyces humatus]